jgi:glycosyltransferase involved in cell wall biosynthesis
MLAIAFYRLGPYHLARCKNLASKLETVVFEMCSSDGAYPWTEQSAHEDNIITLLPGRNVANVFCINVRQQIFKALSQFRPRAVAIPGWSEPFALYLLSWCRRNRIPAVLMTDSFAHEQEGRQSGEFIKSLIVKEFSSAVVSGDRSRDYVVRLGMPEEFVFDGFDVVDNDYFWTSSCSINFRKNKSIRSPQNFILFVGRLVPRKNVLGLINAYDDAQSQSASALPSLVILGDGNQRDLIVSRLEKSPFKNRIHLLSSADYSELPDFYTRALFVVLPSIAETWGLVVNEALASGCPVLVSRHAGSAQLVKSNVNGLLFDPLKEGDLACKLIMMLQSFHKNVDRALIFESVRDWGLDKFSHSLKQAYSLSTERPIRRASAQVLGLIELLAMRSGVGAASGIITSEPDKKVGIAPADFLRLSCDRGEVVCKR